MVLQNRKLAPPTADRDRVFRRMAEPSWLILSVLPVVQGVPGIEILREVNEIYTKAMLGRSLDPSTLHYALGRMESDGLVAKHPSVEVDVPGPRGTVRRELRSVFTITGAGIDMLRHKAKLDALARRAACRNGSLNPVPV